MVSGWPDLGRLWIIIKKKKKTRSWVVRVLRRKNTYKSRKRRERSFGVNNSRRSFFFFIYLPLFPSPTSSSVSSPIYFSMGQNSDAQNFSPTNDPTNNNNLLDDLILNTNLLQCSDATINETPVPMENEFSIIAKLQSDKPTNMTAFKALLLKAWRPKKKSLTNHLQQNTFVCIFEDETDMNRVLNLSWTFRDAQVVLQKWPPNKSLSEIDLTKTSFWVHVFNLPVIFMNPSTASIIGNMIGNFIKSEPPSSAQRWKKSLRFQVEIDITKPLTDQISFERQGKAPV